MFEHLQLYGGDPIFSLGEACRNDPRAQKVNLTVGLYYDDQGRIPLLDTVRDAEARLAAHPEPRDYLPLEGRHDYCTVVQDVVFGADAAVLQEGRVATIQTLGGTGALKIGAELLHTAYPESELWMSDPAWPNHHAVFQGSGIKTHQHSYYDPHTKGVQFDRMLDEIRRLPRHSIVLLHACCHNPTGADLTEAQWQALAAVLAHGGLIPFLDMAYQGFGRGLREDAHAVRVMIDAGLTFLVANSFSKNLSFYGERCGGLSVVCASPDEAKRVFGQLKAAVRRTYSNPPTHGARVVAAVLGQQDLRLRWEAEVAAMRARIAAMRQRVHARLQAQLPDYDAAYLISQQGMFSYAGLSTEQIMALRAQHAVYVLDSGRICLTGLNTHNVDYFSDALASVLTHVTA